MTGPDTPDTSATPPPPVASTPPASNWEAPARPAATVPGSAGFVYADVPNRIVALIIDAIILGIVTAIISGILYGIVGSPIRGDLSLNIVPVLVGTIVSLALSAAYYIYTWTAMRATIGMRLLGMQVGNSPDGATLTQDQAIRRWAVLFAPFSITQIAYVVPLLGALLGLATLGYAIYLLWTTAQSPTKQGFHDQFANTVVVKAARTT